MDSDERNSPKTVRKAVQRASTTGTAVGGAQVGAQTMFLLQLLSMAQSAVMTAVGWIGALVSAVVNAVGAVVAAVVTAVALVAGVFGIGAVYSAVTDVDYGSPPCASLPQNRAAVDYANSSLAGTTALGNAQKVYGVMSAWGMPRENIAGILGNWEQESGIQPAVVQGHKPLEEAADPLNGIGLGQWTGSRNTALREYAAAQSQNWGEPADEWTSLALQLQFMVQGDGSGYVGVVRTMASRSMGTPSDAALYFHQEWEKSADTASMIAARASRADKWYSLMLGWADPSTYVTLDLVAAAAMGPGPTGPGGPSGSPGTALGASGNLLSNLYMLVLQQLGLMCYQAVGDVAADIPSGGMTMDQAQAWMDAYKHVDAADWDINTCGCDGGCLKNCVSLVVYFVNRYTTQHVLGKTGNGRDVATNLASGAVSGVSGMTDGGHVPRPYAIFSTGHGQTLCDGTICGHTGVVLGVDEANDRIIIGEAGCSDFTGTWWGAHQYSLSAWSGDAYTYAYTDAVLRGDPGAQ